MTQRRQSRRASRKINQQRRELKRGEKRRGWLSQNLETAFKALEAFRTENRRLRAAAEPTVLAQQSA